jgi:hypothetical protein
MPALIADYQKQVYVTQLRKSVSAWEQGMKLMLARDEADDISGTEFARVLSEAGYNSYNAVSAEAVPQSTEILKKYFNIIKIEDSPQYSAQAMNGITYNFTKGYRKFYMADGSVYYIYMMTNGTGNRVIDVNGDKGPNISGRDIFFFNVDSRGRLIPYNSDKSNAYWRDDATACGQAGSDDMTNVTGRGCAARIIENGWVMDY